jgi:acyl-CoA reductase-like NAD-dependent aldehyde dehydrogenase
MDTTTPFGGFKRSGYENGAAALAFSTEMKMVTIKRGK